MGKMYQKVSGEMVPLELADDSETMKKVREALEAAQDVEDTAANAMRAAEGALETARGISGKAESAQDVAGLAMSAAESASQMAESAQTLANAANASADAAQVAAGTAQSAATAADAKAVEAQKAAETAQAAAEERVKKSGDTMTGALHMHGASISCTTQSDLVDLDNPPASAVFPFVRRYSDKNNATLSAEQVSCAADKNTFNRFISRKKEDGSLVSAHFTMNADKNGNTTVAASPPALADYSNHVDVTKISIARHLIKLTADKTFYVGGANASDTANLFQGRGESPEMPFASLLAALNFVLDNYISSNHSITIQCNANVQLRGAKNLTNFYRVNITGNAENTLTIADAFYLTGGDLYLAGFSKISLAASLASNAITAQSRGSRAFLCLNCPVESPDSFAAVVIYACDAANVELGTKFAWSGKAFSLAMLSRLASLTFVNGSTVALNGTITGSVFDVSFNSFLRMPGQMTLEGEVTGRRYNIMANSLIDSGGRGANFIPGSIAGVCDTSSSYV